MDGGALGGALERRRVEPGVEAGLDRHVLLLGRGQVVELRAQAIEPARIGPRRLVDHRRRIADAEHEVEVGRRVGERGALGRHPARPRDHVLALGRALVLLGAGVGVERVERGVPRIELR
jgi:hypothetical protein